MIGGLLGNLLTTAVTGVKTLISNAKVGKAVIQSGQTVTSQTSAAGTTTSVAGTVISGVSNTALLIGGAVLAALLFLGWLIFGKK